MLYRPKDRSSYNLVLDKVRYEIPPFIWIDFNGNSVKLLNRFSGVYHKFESGHTEYELGARSIFYLLEKLNKDFDIVDDYR